MRLTETTFYLCKLNIKNLPVYITV